MGGLHKPHRFEIKGRSISARLEPAFLAALRDVVRREKTTQAAILSKLRARHRSGNFSSAVRIYLLTYYRRRAR
jgi:predicted DNA-binding ribbon-helix-helix protein